MVIAIYATVEYKAVLQPTAGMDVATEDQKKHSRYLLAQLILGYIGLLGGIVFYASMRTVKK
jgi:hypothetical protein